MRRNGIDLEWKIDDVHGLDAFSPEAVLHVLRIIQESVTNAVRHAQASRIAVEVRSSDDRRGRLRLSIRDNGRGPQRHVSSSGRGVQNMRSRAEELGALLRIEEASPGTRIELSIPLPA